MKRAWQFLKAHTELIYGAVCIALGIYVWWGKGDVAGGATLVGIGLGIAPLIYAAAWLANRVLAHMDSQILPPARAEEDWRKLGVEPVPTPGEDPFGHGPNCTYCKDWKGPRP